MRASTLHLFRTRRTTVLQRRMPARTREPGRAGRAVPLRSCGMLVERAKRRRDLVDPRSRGGRGLDPESQGRGDQHHSRSSGGDFALGLSLCTQKECRHECGTDWMCGAAPCNLGDGARSGLPTLAAWRTHRDVNTLLLQNKSIPLGHASKGIFCMNDQRRKIQSRSDSSSDTRMLVITGKWKLKPSRTICISPGKRPSGSLDSHGQNRPASTSRVPVIRRKRCM